MKISSISTSPTERTSWRWVPSPQSNEQPLAPASHEGGGQARAAPWAPSAAVPAKSTSRSMARLSSPTAGRTALYARPSPTSSKDRRPPSTRARPMVCSGARRRSVGLPGLKIWKPLVAPRAAAGASGRTRRRRRRGSAHGAARGARRRARRRGPSRSARPPHSTIRSAGSWRRSSSSSDVAVHRQHGRADQLELGERGRRHHVAGVQDQLGRRAADPGRRRAAGGCRGAGGCRRSRRSRGSRLAPPAPVAQWIERCPPEAEVASSNLAGRVIRKSLQLRGLLTI